MDYAFHVCFSNSVILFYMSYVLSPSDKDDFYNNFNQYFVAEMVLLPFLRLDDTWLPSDSDPLQGYMKL